MPTGLFLLSDSLCSFILFVYLSSINHEYKDWDEKNPQLTTCNQNTKNIMQGSTVPQEVETDKDVVFTYDVSFEVLSHLALDLSYSCICAIRKLLLS